MIDLVCYIYYNQCPHIVTNACLYNMQRLKNVFLPYLQEWEDEVAHKTEYTAREQAKMLLSHEMMNGILYCNMSRESFAGKFLRS